MILALTDGRRPLVNSLIIFSAASSSSPLTLINWSSEALNSFLLDTSLIASALTPLSAETTSRSSPSVIANPASAPIILPLSIDKAFSSSGNSSEETLPTMSPKANVALFRVS